MRKSNVDTSKLPKFTSLREAVDYFERFGVMTFFGWETPGTPMYAVYTFRRNDGREYFIDVFEDGTVVVIQRDTELFKDF